jgi:hypothetical protein
MKHFNYAVVTIVLFIFASVAIAQERRFGLGVILGEPTGISAKLWISPVNALDFGLGVNYMTALQQCTPVHHHYKSRSDPCRMI